MTVTHTQRWHAHHHTAGTGPVYQGRFKSFPVQPDEHVLTVARYVERHAVRARLVGLVEAWVRRMAARCEMESTIRARGRPRRS
jgi:putative transposase